MKIGERGRETWHWSSLFRHTKAVEAADEGLGRSDRGDAPAPARSDEDADLDKAVAELGARTMLEAEERHDHEGGVGGSWRLCSENWLVTWRTRWQGTGLRTRGTQRGRGQAR